MLKSAIADFGRGRRSPEVRALLLRIRAEMDAKLLGRPEERPV